MIAAGNEQAVKGGLSKAREIVNDPVRARHLLAKVFGASKHVTNPISKAEKKRRVVALLGLHPGLTTKEIVTWLAPDLNTSLSHDTLAELAREEHVRGEKQTGEPYKRWYLATDTLV